MDGKLLGVGVLFVLLIGAGVAGIFVASPAPMPTVSASASASASAPVSMEPGDLSLWVMKQASALPQDKQLPWLQAMKICVKEREAALSGASMSVGDFPAMDQCARRRL